MFEEEDGDGVANVEAKAMGEREETEETVATGEVVGSSCGTSLCDFAFCGCRGLQ